jgi:hypothetical protein
VCVALTPAEEVAVHAPSMPGRAATRDRPVRRRPRSDGKFEQSVEEQATLAAGGGLT